MAESSQATATRPGTGALAVVWGGAVLFVVSLAVFLWVYLVTFRATGSGPLAPPLLADTALFTLFALHHSILARSGIKAHVIRAVPVWLERSLFTWLASALFLLTCLAWQTVPGRLYTIPGALRWVGYAVQAAGLVMTAIGSGKVDVLDLAGVRPVLDARGARVPRHVPLETHGVYRIVRHPLYLGWALFVFGAPDMTPTRFTFACISTLYLALAIPLEERSLVRVFGDEYRAYQQRTRWRMVPGIW